MSRINEKKDGAIKDPGELDLKMRGHFMKAKNRLSSLGRKCPKHLSLKCMKSCFSDIFNPKGETKCSFCVFSPSTVWSLTCRHHLCDKCLDFLPGFCPACKQEIKILYPGEGAVN